MSLATAVLMAVSCLPLRELHELDLFSFLQIKTSAEDTVYEDWLEDSHVYSISTQVDLEKYSQAYYSHPSNHIKDTIELGIGSGSTRYPITNFISIGSSEAPFQGVLLTNEGSITSLNLDEPLFSYVCDNVKITEKTSSTNAPGQLIFTRTENDTDAPIFADHVVHFTGDDEADETASPVGWDILLDQYRPDEQNTWNHDHAGIFGEIGDGALVEVTFTDKTSGAISGSGDTGLFCGNMGDNSRLTVSLSAESTNTGCTVTSSAGNAGGVVGAMGDGAVLTLKSRISSRISSVTAQGEGKYAGGIVGSNNGGEVVLDSGVFGSESYSVGGTVTGAAGTGGVFGYYRPRFQDGTAAFDMSRYAIEMTVNGNGSVGGLFGVLENKTVVNGTDAAGGAVTVSSGNITTTHDLGNMTNYGGLIGSYSAFSHNEALTVSGISVSVHKDGSSTYTNYGGCIGAVQGESYVRADDFTLSAADNINSHTFGGVVARADSGYIDVSGVTIGAASGSTSTVAGFYGGGIVGSLANGVLKLSGTVDLTNALPEAGYGPNYYAQGQIVGYRDNALIFADGSWTFSRSGRAVDNVGSWGDVIVFGGKLTKSEVLTENTDHTITIAAPGAVINSEEEFAKTALGLQIDHTAAPLVSGTAVSGDASLTFGGELDLTGTGLRGLTRDNSETDSLTAAHCVYSGTVTGGGAGIVLDIQNVGGKPVYRHIYNGLFGIVNGTDAGSLTLGGSFKLNANRGTMYAGTLASRAAGDLTASGITDTASFTADGGSNLYLGRLLGEASGSIGNITIGGTNSFSGDVTGANSADSTCLGGVIGRISHNSYSQARSWSISNTALSGTIKNTCSKHTQKIGGLIAEVVPNYDLRYNTQNRTLTLDGITVNGLTVDGALGRNSSEITNGNYPNLSSGGLLGYSWLNVETALNDISVANGKVNISSNTANFGDTAGLVYQATGKMTVNKVVISGIRLNGETGGAVRSFSVLVNKGWYGNYGAYDRQALYMELPLGYTYNITGDDFDNAAITDFDEILTYSATYHQASTGNSTCARTPTDAALGDGTVSDIMVNGQGIVSISSPGFKTDAVSASGTYEPRTNRGRQADPYTRYYYDLSELSGSDDETEKLVVWGAKQYACSNIKQYFDDRSFAFDADTTYKLQNYSWYPIDHSGSVAGTFELFNYEFEESEKLGTTKWSSLTEGSSATQHFMMHNGLFHDVNGTLNAGKVTLRGSIGATGNGSGALVCGIVSGSAEETAVLDSQNGSISLDGVFVHNMSSHPDYAPLLVNKSGDFSRLNIYHVSNTEAYDNSGRYGAATSLCGNAGLTPSAKNVKVEFKYIVLDGRSSADTPSEIAKSWYGTTHSIFTKATLLNRFTCTSGSDGVYNYEYKEDWTEEAPHDVTYGSELSDSTNRDQYYGEEFWYYGQDHTAGYYTQYSGGTLAGGAPEDNGYPVDFFDFLPYVYDVSEKANVSAEKKYQLKVNHATAELSGCGTYNDPYAVTTGDLETVANILSGSTSGVIILPLGSGGTEYTDTTLLTTTWDSCGHAKYQWDSGTSKFRQFTKSGDTVDFSGTGYSKSAVRKYLAGAYYKLAEDVVLSSGFIGLGSVSGTDDENKGSIFRGVIVGDGYTITNKSNYPLIRTSYGSVVKDVSIVVDADITRTQDGKAVFTENVSCEQYGAVIGQILGGDNIIDGVTVSFAAGKTITLSGTYAQLIPVGGYVGVIVNGALYFRGMENEGNYLRGTDAIKGIPADSAIVTDGAAADLAAENNTKWLYVNPIVGRVLNGFAVTEGEAYRPFEDETREGYDETLSVTMKNGNKNYSIADIDKNVAECIEIGSISTSGMPVNLKNEQALYVLSLIFVSGAAGSVQYEGGDYKDACGYDNTYRLPKPAQYDHVGETQQSADYYTSIDLIPAKANVVPYILRKYTNKASNGKYYARAMCAEKDNSKFLPIITINNKDIVLPDGFRGLGSIYGDIRNTSTDNSDWQHATPKALNPRIMSFKPNTGSVNINLNI